MCLLWYHNQLEQYTEEKISQKQINVPITRCNRVASGPWKLGNPWTFVVILIGMVKLVFTIMHV